MALIVGATYEFQDGPGGTIEVLNRVSPRYVEVAYTMPRPAARRAVQAGQIYIEGDQSFEDLSEGDAVTLFAEDGDLQSAGVVRAMTDRAVTIRYVSTEDMQVNVERVG